MPQKYENYKWRGDIFSRKWEKIEFVQMYTEHTGIFCIFAAVLKTNN